MGTLVLKPEALYAAYLAGYAGHYLGSVAKDDDIGADAVRIGTLERMAAFALGKYDRAPDAMRDVSDRVAELLAPAPGTPRQQDAAPPAAASDEIDFTFGGSRYRAGGNFYDLNLVRLPSGVVLTTGGWLETMPPRPKGLRVATPEEIGNRRIAIAFEGSTK